MTALGQRLLFSRQNLNKMAAQDGDLEAFFLHSIPSLFRQAQRHLHSDNLNVLEYFECRLNDYTYVIGSVILQCEHQNACEGLIQLLDLLHGGVNDLNGQIQDLCNARRNVASEMGFSCPLEQSSGRGRPRFYIPGNVIGGLHDIHGVWREVANEAGVSHKTILRRRYQYSMAVNQTSSGSRITYSEISDARLREIVEEVLQVMPNAGKTYVIGSLRSRGVRVQRWRVREAIFETEHGAS